MTDYEKKIQEIVDHYGEEWLRELGKLIVEGDRKDL